MILMFSLFFEGLLTLYIYRNEIQILQQLKHIYRIRHIENFRKFYENLVGLNTGFNILLYLFGMYSVCSHKVTNYQIFLVTMSFSIFASVLLTYINVLNLLLFILKCFTYVYARLVLSELYTVLIIPNDFLERANPSADSSDEDSITRPAALDNTSDNNSNYNR